MYSVHISFFFSFGISIDWCVYQNEIAPLSQSLWSEQSSYLTSIDRIILIQIIWKISYFILTNILVGTLFCFLILSLCNHLFNSFISCLGLSWVNIVEKISLLPTEGWHPFNKNSNKIVKNKEKYDNDRRIMLGFSQWI